MAAHSLPASVTLSMVATAATLGSAWIPGSSLLAPLRASSVTSLVAVVTGLDADCGDVLSATTTSDVKSDIPVKERAIVSIGCPGNVTSDGRGGL